MTMFAYDCSASEGAIPALLHKISNAPGAGDDVSIVTMLAGAIIAKFPGLLPFLPSPMKGWDHTLRTQLGVVAEEVWHQDKVNESLESKILDLFDEGMSKDEVVAQVHNHINATDRLLTPSCRSLRYSSLVQRRLRTLYLYVLFASSEPLDSSVLQETFLELARQPTIQTKVRDELLAFEQREGRAPSVADLMNPATLPYLEAVTREVMRTKTVLMRISRVVRLVPSSFPSI